MSLISRAISQALRPILSKLKGELIESTTSLSLGFLSNSGIKGKVFRNLYVPKEDGKTAEIDVLFLSSKGIAVIECKGYNGKIIGLDNERNWSVIYPNGEMYSLYNPSWQNYGHKQALISAIRKDLVRPLNKRIPIVSIVVFSDTADITGVKRTNNETRIINCRGLTSELKNYFENRADILTDDEINLFSELFRKYETADKTVKEDHINDTEHNKKYGPSKQLSVKCPKCGKPLMLRTCKKGINEGQQFAGCSGYPNCTYTVNFRKY